MGEVNAVCFGPPKTSVNGNWLFRQCSQRRSSRKRGPRLLTAAHFFEDVGKEEYTAGVDLVDERPRAAVFALLLRSDFGAFRIKTIKRSASVSVDVQPTGMSQCLFGLTALLPCAYNVQGPEQRHDATSFRGGEISHQVKGGLWSLGFW